MPNVNTISAGSEHGERFREGEFPSAGLLQRMYRMLTGAKGYRGVTVLVREDGLKIYGGGAGESSPTSWGLLSLSGNKARVRGGYIIHGNNAPNKVTPPVEIVLSGGTQINPTFVVLEYNYTTKTATIYPNSFSPYPPCEPPNIFRIALHSFYSVGDSFKHIQQHSNSDIITPGFG